MSGVGQAASVKYRPDIDGLRAVAVLPVVFYHFQIAPFTGGFVGVDIFFVISGYLITSLIHSEAKNGTFSLLTFYERRVRRILPALFFMLFVTTALAGLIFFPQDLMRYSRSLIATAFSGSNFYFWSTVDYFDIAANRKPLLHTWSLAVEEQFYLVYPLLFFIFRGASQRSLIQIVATIFVVSLGANIWALHFAPASDFYLLPFRAWELMLGALLALSPLSSSARMSTALAWSGIALIVLSILAFSVDTPFPGQYALIPCIGAACLIHAGPDTIVGRILSLKPLVFIGLISYSVYLWHWPMLVFTRYLVLREFLLWEKAALILLSLGVAAFSWAYVERPFRVLGRVPRKPLFRFAGAALGIFVGASAVGEFSRGLPYRFDPAIRSLVAANERQPAQCDTESVNSGRMCRIGVRHVEPATFLVWGDSHAGSVLPAIIENMQRRMLSGYMAGRGRCAPLVGVTMQSGATGRACRAFNDEVAEFATQTDIRTVILSAQWAAYAEGTNFSADDGSASIFLKDDLSDQSDRRQNIGVFSRGLERTVAPLAHAGKNIIIVASVPEMRFSIPHALARKHLFNLDVDIRLELKDYLARQMNVLNEIERMQGSYGATVIYPHQKLCATGYCEAMRDEVAYYSDTQHLTEFGAKLLSPLFEDTPPGTQPFHPQ